MQYCNETYSKFSKRVFSRVARENVSEIHVIFDQYFEKSIKNYERSIRNDASYSRPHFITEDGPVPTNFLKELRNNQFKDALVKFFINHWSSDELLPFIGNKKIYLNYDNCYVYRKSGNHILKQEDPMYTCPAHEEADTKLIYHVCNTKRKANFEIHCSDTDILVILLGNMHKIDINNEVYLKCGTQKKLKIINVNDLYEELGADLSKSLPVFHALTGNDYNPSFYRRGKLTTYKVLKKNPEYQKLFANLAEKTPLAILEDFKEIQMFVCEFYGFKRKKKS